MLALITATYNSLETLPDTLSSIESVKGDIKSFFVDGASKDGTLDLLRAYVAREPHAVLMEQNGTGLYEALNQGVQAAIDDPDISHIGLLHSDDKLISKGFDQYLSVIEAEPRAVFYSGIEFHDDSGSIVRVWKSGDFSMFKLNTGWMPPHTSIVVAKEVYCELGLYNPDFGTAADYEWVVRVFSTLGHQSRYFPERTVAMRVGGASSSGFAARLRANAMDGRVWAKRSRLQSVVVRLCKPARKIGQFVFHK